MTDEFTPARASDWMILLKEDPTDRVMAGRFRMWLDESPENVRDWTEIAHTYSLIGKTLPVHEDAWRHAGPAKRTWRRKLAPVAVLLAAACCAVLIAPMISLRIQSDYMTTTAETRSVRLADGTQVHMGPKTALAVAYSASERRVRLLSGEAFFEVTPNPERPFKVRTRGIETTVLGTAFDVHIRSDGTEVGVQHGHVRVSHGMAGAELLAGDGVRMAWDGRMTPLRLLPQQVATWRQGQIIAKNASVSDVVDDIRPYYAGLILIRGDHLSQQHVTGMYRMSDPQAALQAVALAQNARVRRVTPWLTILSEK